MEPSGAGRRIFAGLHQTREALGRRFRALFAAAEPGDLTEILVRVEEALLLADVGPALGRDLVDTVRSRYGASPRERVSYAACRALLLKEMADLLGPAVRVEDACGGRSPAVLVFVGTHGVGKTTTVGRLAHRFGSRGLGVLVAGSDTHRPAAGEQVGIWAERAGAELVTQRDGADAAAVVYDALTAAKTRGLDVVLVDTAGRMHTERNPMEDLRKIFRVAGRVVPDAPHGNFLVIDATTGQNGLRQAMEFRAVAEITGVILTKMDGTARGGIALAIRRQLGIPIACVGVGEGPGDLIDFDPGDFLDALLPPSVSHPAGCTPEEPAA
ncbi:MAG: signal recognition particle-docking protein FtsY [Acidobacteria bacterium]|nr:signal recognition particle-docking protein FtsY [Acidobacteriota bacterium]